MYQKDLNMSYLLDFYGDAIPPRQKEIMSQYYDEDLSLAEIAESFDMSRQGVRHQIKKGEEQLLFLEDKLGLAKIHRDAVHFYSEFDSCLLKLESAIDDIGMTEEIASLLNELRSSANKMKIG